ncbi:MAG: ATP-binding protein [Marinilabiliaceae bacterium]|nr:ATP-binding protein [Marinilabiliaceae bacterium]
MTDNDKKRIAHLSETLDQILSGYCISKISDDNLEPSEDSKVNELSEKLYDLARQYKESYQFIIELSGGKLNIEPPRRNTFVMPFKQLHSELRHLTWQIKEIAEGDYDQRVSFSGDFSEAFNKMLFALREKQALANTIHENEYLFRSIFNTSPIGILICDLNFNILNFSRSAKRMLRLNFDDVEKNYIDLLDPSNRETGEWIISEMTNGKTALFAEVKFRRKDEVVFWVEQNTGIYYDSKKNPKGIVVIFSDISSRKADEEQILKYTHELRELNNTKDKLFSIIAHDLKNPFHALLGISSALSKEVSSGNLQQIQNYADIIFDSAKKGYELLTNLLEWTRLQSGRLKVIKENLSILEIINENISLVTNHANAKNLSIQYVDDVDYQIFSDKAIINVILRNLISNAIKFTPFNGKISITIRETENFLIISVIDNGIGITEEDMKKLFRLDVTHTTVGTNNEIGTGLGLIICKEFVNKIGGSVYAESIYGQGATFTFTIPKK